MKSLVAMASALCLITCVAWAEEAKPESTPAAPVPKKVDVGTQAPDSDVHSSCRRRERNGRTRDRLGYIQRRVP